MPGQSVSVIIPVYNVTAYLDEAIASVQSQDYPDIQIIVVNDGSDAAASEKIAAICAGHHAVELVHQPNTGQAIARRNGVRLARGEYILFLDADDMFLPGAVSHLVQVLLKNPTAIAAYGRQVLIDRDGNFTNQRVLPRPEQAVSGNILPALLKGVPLLLSGCVCMRRDITSRVAFPEHMRQAEDWATWCLLALSGDILYAGERTVMCRRTHDKNISSEVLENPAALLGVLDNVYENRDIMARVGVMPLAVYRAKHVQSIHTYLCHYYGTHRQHIRARRHSIARLFLPPVAKGDKIRIVHVVKWLYAGGAERLLSSLLRYSDPARYEHIVISLSDRKERLADIEQDMNIPYIPMHIARGRYRISGYLRCLSLIRSMRPDVIKTWLPPANIAGGIIGRILRIPVIWGIHDAQSPESQPALTRKQIPLSKILPRRIVCCSSAVYEACRRAGYKETLMTVVPNGVDSTVFSTQPEGRAHLRAELGIGDNVPLIGMAAEYASVKRHAYFLAAAKEFLVTHPHAQFLLCGNDVTNTNLALQKILQLSGIEKHVHVLGIRNDMPAVYSSMDINTLVSRSESFGLSIAEAMACKTLNVATDVGIMKELLQDVGTIIPVTDDTQTLVAAWAQVLRLSGQERSVRLETGRNRIIRQYSIIETARAYDGLYEAVRRYPGM